MEKTIMTNKLESQGMPQVYHSTVLDLGIADKAQVELFGAVGRTKGPFTGVIDWPFLNGVVEDRSRELLNTQGEEAWRAAGGVYGDDSKPTFARRANLAGGIVQGIANGPGGFIWTDMNGTGWAVRLVSLRDPNAYAGLAISWNGGGRVIDPLAREEYRRAVEQQMAELDEGGKQEARRKLQDLADRLWLYERGEQILWAIHAAVLMQRSSVVLLPDIGLGQIIWGGNHATWPANWRNTIMDVLMSLGQLHVAALRIGGTEWRPKFTMRSVAVAHCEIVERTQRQGDVCQRTCPLWNQPVAHEHFRVQIGYGFLGLLENFAIHDDREGGRQFDFEQRKPEGEAGKLITDARSHGQIVPVHLPAKVFGPSDWSGLTQGQRGIIQGLVREVTRVKARTKSSRRDKADMLIGNQVPDVHGRQVVCPLLRADGRYLSFNGNGARRGQGYLIIGNDSSGWLAKCGYDTGATGEAAGGKPYRIGNAARTFLADLAELVRLLGLTVVGIARRNEQWLTLKRLQEIADLPAALDLLREIHLRIYGPEDFHNRFRGLIAERGQLIIPGGDNDEAPWSEGPLMRDANLDLKIRLKRAGLTQQALAEHLGVSQPFVSALLRGKKNWPEGLRKRAEELIPGNRNQEQ